MLSRRACICCCFFFFVSGVLGTPVLYLTDCVRARARVEWPGRGGCWFRRAGVFSVCYPRSNARCKQRLSTLVRALLRPILSCLGGGRYIFFFVALYSYGTEKGGGGGIWWLVLSSRNKVAAIRCVIFCYCSLNQE